MQATSDITPYLGKLIRFRRDLHAHPELKFEEFRTSDQIAAYLGELGLTVHRGLSKTGIVATLRGTGPNADDPKRAIALRADMDALPVTEKNQFEHISQNVGRMHACGHDGHTAMLLGGATLLQANPDFDGTLSTEGNFDLRLPPDKMQLFVSKKYPILNESLQALLNGTAIPPEKAAVQKEKKKS